MAARKLTSTPEATVRVEPSEAGSLQVSAKHVSANAKTAPPWARPKPLCWSSVSVIRMRAWSFSAASRVTPSHRATRSSASMGWWAVSVMGGPPCRQGRAGAAAQRITERSLGNSLDVTHVKSGPVCDARRRPAAAGARRAGTLWAGPAHRVRSCCLG
ncbi:hypothetical protein MICRO116_660034 [Micrococcus sp. 116]|nr:hypothetical protein MICRO116_660034 [Micrococcus sp. 116]